MEKRRAELGDVKAMDSELTPVIATRKEEALGFFESNHPKRLIPGLGQKFPGHEGIVS